jgi:hypothetical protein
LAGKDRPGALGFSKAPAPLLAIAIIGVCQRARKKSWGAPIGFVDDEARRRSPRRTRAAESGGRSSPIPLAAQSLLLRAAGAAGFLILSQLLLSQQTAPFSLEFVIIGVGVKPGLLPGKETHMCDFSLQSVRSRPAKVADKLMTRNFGTGTRGFASTDDLGMAVCLLPGTELAFAGEVVCLPGGLGWKTETINHQTAIFRQVNKEKLATHHDALEFPDGNTVLLTRLSEGQAATVLQLPAQPKTELEVREQRRVGFVG